MATKKYSLAIEKIDEVAKEFVAARPAYTLHIKECNQGRKAKADRDYQYKKSGKKHIKLFYYWWTSFS